MKELSIEQKAKAYDEALERMKSWARGEHPECFTEAQKTAEFIFPELCESKDERIRKELIEFVKSRGGFKQEYIAWLEKQGEQKSTDKIKPKFKVGDKVIGIVSDMQYYITDVCYDHYYTESGCIIMFCSQDNFELVEQKPAWSREDEKIRQTIINEFKQCSEWYCSNGLTKEDCINWLNKQEYFEWGDEDNENMNSLCVLLDQMVSINAIGNEHSIEYKNWLKSIKQRMGG